MRQLKRQPTLSSVCATIDVHVEDFRGAGVEERVTQRLVTMSRAAPSEEGSRRRWRICVSRACVLLYRFTPWVFNGRSEGIILSNVKSRASSVRRKGTCRR